MVELEHEVGGTGEPVVLVHAGVVADFFEPLMAEPALRDRHRLVRYHRVGYGGSERVAGPVGIEQQAAQCQALLGRLGIGRAHLVGHSSGANIALQLALDAPATVGSLALLEPALLPVPSRAAWVEAVAVPAVARYRAGDRAEAVDIWMRGVAGPGWRRVLDDALPGAFDQAVADAGTFFDQELPAVQAWSFGPEEAARVTQPVLAVLGGDSHLVSPVWGERQALLEAWLGDVEPFVLAGATHLLHLQRPQAMAEALAGFFARHPLTSP
jgi:pimeloyl-ACP methyl ester carboxylesterase